MKHSYVPMTAIFSVACGALVLSLGQSMKQSGEAPSPSQISEITIERVYEGCEGCPDNKIVIRREQSDPREYKEATVVYTERAKKPRQGKLSSYYYDNLLKFIEAQKYFAMKDEYAMGWEDSLIVRTSVVIGDKRKVIRTRSEGDVPMELWGLFMAIDGAAAKTKWEGE